VIALLRTSALACAGALALNCAIGCARAPRPAAPIPAPVTTSSVPGDSAALARTVALAAAREWTVRVITLRGDTLVGRIGLPLGTRIRIRLREVELDHVASLERQEDRGGGLYETRLLAGAGVGAMAGLVAGMARAYAGDLETGSVSPWMMAGAIVGLLVEAPRARHEPAVTWLPLWRRG
jgi:hypothetical protein